MGNSTETEILKSPDLKPTDPSVIETQIKKGWPRIRTTVAPSGEKLIVPNGWHGEGKEGDVQILFGDMLTNNIAGTELSALTLTQYLKEKGFLFENANGEISPEVAAELFEGDGEGVKNNPLVRAVRTSGVPVCIELYYGARSNHVKTLSFIGDLSEEKLTPSYKEMYRTAVSRLFQPFIGMGTTAVKERLGIARDVKKVSILDDCAAVASTIIGDKKADEALGRKKPGFEVYGVSVSTTHALVIALALQEIRGIPMLFRAGAPSFGLGDGDNLNYLVNTLPDMKAIAKLTSGDFGNLMALGSEADVQPHIEFYGNCPMDKVTRVFFNGGGPVASMLAAELKRTHKPHHGVVEVLRASRINNGPEEWGLIMNGKHINQFLFKRGLV